jgi:hypothetical protein
VPNVMLGVVLLGGGFAVAHGSLSVGELVAFVGLLNFVAWPLDSLGWLLANAQHAATAAQRIYEVLDEPVTIVDRPNMAASRAATVRADVDVGPPWRGAQPWPVQHAATGWLPAGDSERRPAPGIPPLRHGVLVPVMLWQADRGPRPARGGRELNGLPGRRRVAA